MKYFYLTAALLLSAPAFAGEEELPPLPLPNTPAVVGTLPAGAQPSCSNKAELAKYLNDLRISLRKEYALKVSQSIPGLNITSPQPGVTCIHKKEAFFSNYTAADDTFTLSCLAHSQVAINGHLEDKFSHIIQFRTKADPNCLSQASINDFVKGTACLMPGGLDMFTQGMRSCAAGVTQELVAGHGPPIVSAPVARSIDMNTYTALLQFRPAVGKIIDEDRRVKGTTDMSLPSHGSGPADSSSSVGDVDDCSRNVFNCTTTPAK